ncbi:MAG: GTPase HflX [Meiothermus sp.]|uniref:GTPase HflX n=2 Tax=Meiothermus hypogaeus TaxID=884155 RepID=A0A511R430_9DEIN|nr:GTPase HflX [Meiothermus hypogaeus]RIH77834.1 GTPase HflX [Meiothermus hypogaeus]GEM83642.1 GTPase HflX [Meiothermus hypogaeus NBRC 106114]GIW38107.1 MAG: GTPase HflX [Meiothermus sp.]
MEKIFGRTNGLKPSEKKRLANLYNRRVGANRLVSAELVRTLAALSEELEKPISLLFDRGGRVIRVAVGDAKELPVPESALVETRLSGYRVLHTHLGSGGLSRPDLSMLFLHRLDAMAALEVEQGHPGKLHLAQLSPPRADEEDWQILPSRPYHEYLEWDVSAAVGALEEELSRQARGLDLRDGSGERALLVGLDQGEGVQAEVDLSELAELARTAGAIVAHKELVFRPSLDPRYAVGRGKVEELVSQAYHQNAGTLIFGIELSAAQARELEAITGLKVLDRTQLILDIFAQHARTPEAKVQVELAQLKYLLPRLVGKGKELSRLGGGIGTRGPGETKLEVDRRRLQDRIAELTRKLREIAGRRQETRRQREKSGLPIVGVVGYTNAGKTTLMQALAKKGEEGENKLFATLRPLTRRGFLPGIGEVLYTDTVGFIRRMPSDLLEAFRSTLEELRDADVLLHVLDASQEGALERYQVVEGLLADLGVEAKRILVLSKADQAGGFDLEFLKERLGGVPVSAVKGFGLQELKEALASTLVGQGVRPVAWAYVPPEVAAAVPASTDR